MLLRRTCPWNGFGHISDVLIALWFRNRKGADGSLMGSDFRTEFGNEFQYLGCI